MIVVTKHFYYFIGSDKFNFFGLLNKYNYTVASLAAKYGCSRSYMYNVINGVKPVNDTMFDFFQLIFRCDPFLYELFNYEVKK